MDKGKSDRTHFMSRTGSFSTHGKATGEVTVLPPSAAEETYATAREQWANCLYERRRTEKRLAEIEAQCRLTLRAEWRAKLMEEREMLKAHIAHLNKRGVELRAEAADLGRKSYCEVFTDCAWKMLDHETCHKIKDEAERILGRRDAEVKRKSG